jgi:predicted protein tyrosine phosphatase
VHPTEVNGNRVLSAIIVWILAAGSIGCAGRHNAARPRAQFETKEGYVPGISDFGKVDDFLYRGGQPTEEGIEQLRKIGMDTVVDLRSELHGLIENEREHVEGLGMRFINLPGGGWSTPKEDEIVKFFALVREQPRKKIFIHCWLGGDRSGVFIAAYRICFDGWTPEKAVEEMRAFHYLEFWHPNMKHYVLGFPERVEGSPQLRGLCQAPPTDG